ncbi:hypothetical protein BHE74_00026663 [Ensete ventricosum]|nr:hypothetical protein GW17_00010650 [Ensete ventricosum]RWW65995.1 hypothetical protein BHE74_00026663 [Ensete ventricosum]RZS06059.1 hypothetical protein BHM03_00036649 [Ensete ventricosum]
MPSTYPLSTSSELLRGRGRSFLSGNTCFVLSEPLSFLGCGRFLLFPKSSVVAGSCDRRTTLSGLGTIPRNVNTQRSWSKQWFPFRRSIMSSSSAFLGWSELSARRLARSDARSAHGLSGMMRVGICYNYKGFNYCSRASGSLNNRQPWGTNMIYKCFWSDAHGTNWRSNSSIEPRSQDFQTSHTASFSAGAASDVSFDAAMPEEQLQNSDVSSEQYVT